MTRLIDDLLDFSSLSHAKKFETVNLNKILEEVLAEMEISITEKKASVEYDKNFPSIQGDAVQLAQLFQNLISNAIKFRKKEGPSEIRITAEEKPNEYLFTFKDNGIGIDEQYKERIFVVFQRLHDRNETVTRTGGTSHWRPGN